MKGYDIGVTISYKIFMIAFFISNSYVESTFLVLIEYLTKLKVNTFFLLKENHTNKEFLIRNHKNVSLCDSIDCGILNSDIIIVVNCNLLPTSTLKEIEDKSKLYNKKMLVLETLLYNKCADNWNTSRKKAIGIPNICLFSIGNYSQIEQTEIVVHKILDKIDIKTQYQLSPTTDYILKQTLGKVTNTANGDISNQLGISVVTYLYNDILELLNDYILIQDIHRQQPDCIIVNLESSFCSFDKMKNIFLYRFNKEIDLFVISNYSKIHSLSLNRRPIYHENIPNIDNHILINATDFEKRLESLIYSKIMFQMMSA